STAGSRATPPSTCRPTSAFRWARWQWASRTCSTTSTSTTARRSAQATRTTSPAAAGCSARAGRTASERPMQTRASLPVTPVSPAPAAKAVAVRHRLRAMLSWLHLWVGLLAGTVFALVGLSGSVLVFHDDMLQWQHPQLAGHEPRADGAVLARIFDQWSPEGLGSVHLPEPDGVPTWQGYFGDGRRGYFDPATGNLLLMRSAD